MGYSRLGAGHSWREHRRDEQAQVYQYQQRARIARACRWLMAQPQRRAILAFLRTGYGFAKSLRNQLRDKGSLSSKQTSIAIEAGRRELAKKGASHA